MTRYDIESNKSTTKLHRVEASGSTSPFTGGDADDTAPTMSLDGDRVAFLRKRGDDEKPQVHVMRVDGGEATKLTDFPLGVDAITWMPDGDSLLAWVPLYRGHNTVEATNQEIEARKDRKVSAIVSEDLTYRYWDHWVANGVLHHLFRVDSTTGESTRLSDRAFLVDFDGPAGSLDVAPDGTEIAFHAAPDEDPYAHEYRFGVYTMQLDGSDPQLIDPDPIVQFGPRYSPDGRYLVYGSQPGAHEFYADRVRLLRVDRATTETVDLTPEWDRSPSSWEFADADHLILVAEDNARTRLFHLSVDGGTPARLTDGGTVGAAAPAGGVVWCTHNSLTEPPAAAVVDEQGLRRVGDPNTELASEWDLGTVEDVRFAGADGDEIQMFVISPPGHTSGPIPLVHNVHGGPHGVNGDTWYFRWNSQVFASTGYAVACVNFHGSSSWGQEFGASILGAWGDKPTIDVMTATDLLIEQGLADPERIAIAGGSYGGYLVAWMITQSDRFAACICHAGVIDLLGQWASDVRTSRDKAFGGLPWTNPEAMNRWSPADRMHDVVTPTLVVHGEKDYRVVVTQGLELYNILVDKGVPARLVYYPDEGHWILKPQNSIHWYGEFMDWLHRHLDA